MPRNTDQTSDLTQSTSLGINLSSLRRKRGNIIGHITSFNKLLDNMEQPEQRDIGLLRAHVSGLKDVWERFDDVQFELESADESEIPRRFEIHNHYVAAIARANKLIEGEHVTVPSRRNTTESSATSVSAPMAIKLPEMRLPTFDGKIEDWASYFDSFSSMIDQNPDLTPVQKLQYLRSTLTGRAAACIQCLSTTDANYADAIELLKEKFDCKRRILSKHCDAILTFPKLTKDTPTALGELVDTVRQNLRSLKNLQIDITSWDCMLISIILSKINVDTAWHWEVSLKDKQMPSYSHLLDFLEKRANCAAIVQSNSIPNSVQNRVTSAKPSINKTTTRAHAFLTTNTVRSTQGQRTKTNNGPPTSATFASSTANITNINCPLCQEAHGIWRCERFHALSADQRLEAVKRESLCQNCLRHEHIPELCKKGSCRICQKPHNTLLHQPRQVVQPAGTTSTARAVPPDEQDQDSKQHKLADTDFHRPAPVDLLLGSGATLSLLSVGQINLALPDEPGLYLQKTKVGWVIGGSPPTSESPHSATCHTIHTLQFDMARFWEIEEGPQIQHLSDSNKKAETHYVKHTKRNADGRYVVALPFKENFSQLGESKFQAFKRLESLERKLQRDPILQKEYRTVMNEYLELNHMEQVTEDQDSSDGYYLPHHGVRKVTSETTKLRVVFDASAGTTSGLSLNDTLHTGPKIQEDLLYILIRFRIHRYVLTGDIEKMYRQFLVRDEDRKFQRILWRDEKNQVTTYQLKTVTFGLSAAPFLAIRSLVQLAHDERHRFPTASQILLRDFYVDDLLTGAATLEQARRIRKELTLLLDTARLNIRQWASNCKALLEDLPEQALNKKLHIGESSTLKTLGVVWNSSQDTITYEVKPQLNNRHTTKRFISSEIAKIYDPLGLLGPVIIIAKILLQKVWTIKIDWDESLPMDLHTEWISFYKQLPLLNNTIFNRNILINFPVHIELHGFCDASERAYGACIYVRSTNADGQIQVDLLLAKSKVAPLKTQSIPRLELCAALLLSTLMTTAKKALHLHIHHVTFWTDSTVVLHWLRTSPHLLKTFVANRVSEIQTTTDIINWRHVPTDQNPADLISRGQTPEEFLRHSIWQHGPDWLTKTEDFWPTNDITSTFTKFNITDIPEQKTAICLVTNSKDTNILDSYSSWSNMQRIVARCLRWRTIKSVKGNLTVLELRHAHDVLIKLLQEIYFGEELHRLSRNKLEVGGKLQRLNPFLDKEGILRVGGRLRNAMMPFSQRHPIILPKARVTQLIIEEEHRTQLHAGIQNTLYAIRRRHWPIDGRSQVWRAIKTCTRCVRARPPPVDYVMGNLPEARVTESRPFTFTGVDYCGPFYIKEMKHRNRTRVKVYVAVFVCLAVKAVHLELVSDLTTDAFLAALRRFIARRGHCKRIHSDNGTNFVGASNELREVQALLKSQDHHSKIQTFLADRAIEWSFIPPHAPHFGGLWEAAEKAFKHHLIRVVGTELITFEDLNTLIIEIEAILNSRPLTPISSDSKDLLILTPGHFLIGDSLTSLRERDFTDVPGNRLSSWQHIQQMKQHFWKRWHREYLNELTRRTKWTKGDHPIKEGTVVLLREDNIPPMQWALGRVVKAYPGSDGIVRAVTVKTATGILDRSTKKLVPLPNQSEEVSDGNVDPASSDRAGQS